MNPEYYCGSASCNPELQEFYKEIIKVIIAGVVL